MENLEQEPYDRIDTLKEKNATIASLNSSLQTSTIDNSAIISSLNTSLQTLNSDNDSIRLQLESVTSELNIKSQKVVELENFIQSQIENQTSLDQIRNEIITLSNKVNDDNEHIKNNHENIINTINSNHNTTTELIKEKNNGCNCIIS